MRFPKLSDLDRDQARIYQGAPVVGTILVTGPPGTGKTVIAFHRAHMLKQRKQQPKVMMYNKVLSKYASNRDTVAADVDVSTLHSWVQSWWKGLTGNARPPAQDPSGFVHDWDKIRTGVIQVIVSKEKKENVSWGHIIIDEGQDFPAVMYACMRTIMDLANQQGVSPNMAMTVLADENQRLQADRNATLEQIRVNLGLHESNKNVFTLSKNYRNSYEIAKFAANFYVGLKTGMPDLPEERKGGQLPVVTVADFDAEGQTLNAFVEKIARYARAHPGEEIGVFVSNNKKRSSMVNRLRTRFKNGEIVVQSYASQDKDNRAEDLVFDEPGHVTVLNFQSIKGLEFDAVFVVDPGGVFQHGNASELSAKMSLYVMSSRARSYLNLMLVKDDLAKTILGWLPAAKGNYELEKLP